MQGLIAFGCGQCLPCRINKRRTWAHRLMLEAFKHSQSAFVTLTYDDEHLPERGSLKPEHTKNWMKRLRKALAPVKIRFFLVGEYGDETGRPHYHAAIFGYGGSLCVACPHGFTRIRSCRCLYSTTWPFGKVYVGQLTKDSAQYIAGYVTKKIMSPVERDGKGLCQSTRCKRKRECKHFQFKHPEFTRMSLRPGIAAAAAEDIARSLDNEFGKEEILNAGDVPSILYHSSRGLPLGRYLRAKIRAACGVDGERVRDSNSRRYSMEMSELYRDVLRREGNSNKGLRRIITDSNGQKALNQESVFKIFTHKKERRKL